MFKINYSLPNRSNLKSLSGIVNVLNESSSFGGQGTTGPTGPKGDSGLSSNTGSTGSQGIQGIQGPTGSFQSTSFTNFLLTNISIDNANQFYDGPTIGPVDSGTWVLSGTISVVTSGSSGQQNCAKLWANTGSGTGFTISTCAFSNGSSGSFSISGIHTCTIPTTYKISVLNTLGVGVTKMLSSTIGGEPNTASSMYGFRIGN